MAGNDNILQAPAQGFGQTVTFTNNPDPRNTPSMDGTANLGQTRGGVQGFPVAGGQQRMTMVDAPPPNPTMELLQKVAGSYLQTKLRAEKAAAFVTGMQRAAGGEAIKDIATQQPWYSAIFGESDVVEGARTYTAHAKAAEAAAAIEDNMSEVRKLEPQESNSYFSKLVADHMTGDDATDAVLMQGFARTLPATMRRQAKEHYAWRQEEASRAESGFVMAASNLYQKGAAKGDQTPEEQVAEAQKLIAGMLPAEGRDRASWEHARVQNLVELAREGQFHAINVWRKAGLIDLLPSDSRTKVEAALDTAANRTLSNKLIEHAPELGRIAGAAKVYTSDGPKRTIDDIMALNALIRKQTGIDRDAFSMDKASGIIADAWSSYLHEAQKNLNQAKTDAREALKVRDTEQAKEFITQGIRYSIAVGGAGDAKHSDLPHGMVDKEFYDQWLKWDEPTRAQVMFNNFAASQYVNPRIVQENEGRLQGAVAGPMPHDFLATYQTYRALADKNPGMAGAYVGKYEHRMAYYDSVLDKSKPVGSQGEGTAYNAAFAMEPPTKKHLSPDDKAAALKALRSEYGFHVLGPSREALQDGQDEQMFDHLHSKIAAYAALPNVTLPEAVQRAQQADAQANGSDTVGGYFIQGRPGLVPLSTVLRTKRPGIGPSEGKGQAEDAPQVWDKHFREKILDMAREVGVTVRSSLNPLGSAYLPEGVAISREADVNGVAWMTVTFKKDGVPLYRRLSSDAIENRGLSKTGRKVSGAVTQE